MLDKILNFGKEELGNLIQAKTGLESSKAEQSVNIAGESIMEGIQSEISGGNIAGLASLLGDVSSLTPSNPIISNITTGFITKLTSKLDISEDLAKTVSSISIPFILGKFGEKAKDGSLMEMAMGLMGKDDMKADMGGMLNDFLGGDSAKKDGKNSLDDIKGKLGGLF